MTEQGYRHCMEWIEKHVGTQRIRFVVNLLTVVTAVCYGLAVLWLLYQREVWIVRVILVPAAGFAAVTVFRRWFSASRPYEVYGFTPLLEKETKGNSFPSRHVFSNMIIAMAVLTVWVPAGIFLLGCGVLLAILRVVTGVHFPRDVIAGALVAILLGTIAFYFV